MSLFVNLSRFWRQTCWLCTAPCQRLLCELCWQALPWYTNRDENIFACFHYAPPIEQMITHYKFNHQLSLARLLSHCFIAHLTASGTHLTEKPDYLLPVPLHKKRLKMRGFNQALEIAKSLSHALHIPIDKHTLQRHKYTEPQFSVSHAKRKTQLHHAFRHTRKLAGEHIAIIDDVYTTGATTLALRQQLLHAGAKRVSIWVIAKTPLGR